MPAPVGTVREDDPQLTARLDGVRRQPLKVLVDSRLEVDLDARILKGGDVLVVCARERDDAARTALIEGEGKAGGGAESAKVKARMEVLAEGDGSRVVITTDLEIRGRAAQMGAGMITSVSKQLIGQAAACIGARIAATGDVPDAALPVAGEVSGIGLVASAASAKVGDAFRRLGRKGGEEQG